jgi:hypothetical protein
MTDAKKVVAVAHGFRRILSPKLSEESNASALYTDLADMYGICIWYSEYIEKLFASRKRHTADELETMLIEFEVQLIDHFAYHAKSLKRLMPRLLKEINSESDNKRRVKKETASAERKGRKAK